jgi:Raf kinase inhibitor-like YbhB/YbcL family protein
VRHRSEPPAVGRRSAVCVAIAPLALVVAVSLSACDTGDGKTLRPVDPNATTIAPAVVSSDSGALPSIGLDGTGVAAGDGGLGDGGFLPGDSIPSNEFSDEGFALFAPWLDGTAIDARYTCDGDDVQPPLSWKSPPAGTVQLAFVMVDESSITDGAPFVHWVMGGVDPTEESIPEGQAPVGAIVGSNSFRAVGWSGPCPPVGDGPHTYRMTMYALNQQVELADGTPAAEFIDYIETLSIGSTDLSFVYER